MNIQVAHYDFFVYEIFTYLITILLKRRKFSQIPKFLTGYYYKSKVWTGLTGFGVFYPNDEIFDVINNRRKKTFISFRAEVVKERSNYSGIDFEQLMQTDLLLYIFYLLRNDDKNMLWYPQTLIYKGVTSGPFELFLRATSKSFYGGSFLKMGISIDAFKGIREKLEDHRHYSALGWANLVKLSNIDNIATNSM